MANLFNKQAKLYRQTRPSYPPQLFDFIASKTHNHDLAWDVGTGSGQAAISLAKIYKNVVATDTSEQQLSYAPKLPNIRYQQTPPTMSLSQLHHTVAPRDSVDVITAAQSFHWFDAPEFFNQAKSVLRKPQGVLAVWCYTEPSVNEAVDALYATLYKESKPYWADERKKVDDRYASIDFPFEGVEGISDGSTGPFEFVSEKAMTLEAFFTYIRSWSAYQTARSEGVELLSEEVVNEFERAWRGNGNGEVHCEKIVRYPVHLRIGKVGTSYYEESDY
ncbi:hypothetical protein Syun_023221 [Stephania yunnanensis]|uniref:Methyltransferase type 11 domain-containing protein n=1 Tax=Stephania yunnanensis TaxID=152371 RepID=A0AAP0FB76_9MAGN